MNSTRVPSRRRASPWVPVTIIGQCQTKTSAGTSTREGVVALILAARHRDRPLSAAQVRHAEQHVLDTQRHCRSKNDVAAQDSRRRLACPTEVLSQQRESLAAERGGAFFVMQQRPPSPRDAQFAASSMASATLLNRMQSNARLGLGPPPSNPSHSPPTPVAGIFTHTSEHATGRQRSQASPGAHSRLLTPLATANLAHTNERADGPFPPRRLAGARTKLRKPTDTRHRRCASIGGPTKPAPCWAVKTLLRVRVQSSPQPPQAASNWTRRHAPAAGPLDAERRSCARISSTLGDQRPPSPILTLQRLTQPLRSAPTARPVWLTDSPAGRRLASLQDATTAGGTGAVAALQYSNQVLSCCPQSTSVCPCKGRAGLPVVI